MPVRCSYLAELRAAVPVVELSGLRGRTRIGGGRVKNRRLRKQVGIAVLIGRRNIESGRIENVEDHAADFQDGDKRDDLSLDVGGAARRRRTTEHRVRVKAVLTVSGQEVAVKVREGVNRAIHETSLLLRLDLGVHRRGKFVDGLPIQHRVRVSLNWARLFDLLTNDG